MGGWHPTSPDTDCFLYRETGPQSFPTTPKTAQRAAQLPTARSPIQTPVTLGACLGTAEWATSQSQTPPRRSPLCSFPAEPTRLRDAYPGYHRALHPPRTPRVASKLFVRQKDCVWFQDTTDSARRSFCIHHRCQLWPLRDIHRAGVRVHEGAESLAVAHSVLVCGGRPLAACWDLGSKRGADAPWLENTRGRWPTTATGCRWACLEATSPVSGPQQWQTPRAAYRAALHRT